MTQERRDNPQQGFCLAWGREAGEAAEAGVVAVVGGGGAWGGDGGEGCVGVGIHTGSLCVCVCMRIGGEGVNIPCSLKSQGRVHHMHIYTHRQRQLLSLCMPVAAQTYT